ncbi:hypothetical protein FRIGORI9N_70031 [Frigoribacterium sp. 9N]|nr:hypothetical protein FRIGORI9N_70031 [Frigoribacterium sp. 9N]
MDAPSHLGRDPARVRPRPRPPDQPRGVAPAARLSGEPELEPRGRARARASRAPRARATCQPARAPGPTAA